MTESSTLNPEIVFAFEVTPTIKLKMFNFEVIPSFCNSEFNPQSLKLTEISSDINIGITQAQDSDEYLFSNSSEMINIHCSKPNFSKIMKFNRISRIDDVDDCDDIITKFYLAESTNLSFVSGKSGRFDASLLHKASNSIKDHTPVRKSADAPQGNGNGYVRNQYHVIHPNEGNGNGNGNGNNAANRVIHPNAGNGAAAGGNNVVNRNDDPELNRPQRLTINEYDEEDILVGIKFTLIVPSQYNSWNAFADAVYQHWRIGQANAPEIVADMDPSRCWPGFTTVFGRANGAEFIDLNWPQHSWQAVRGQINRLRVLPTRQ